jgi:hypothetical protein
MLKKFFLLALLTFILSAWSQDDDKPWERLGLSQTEWKMIQDNNLNMNLVEKLLKYGVSIGEYLQKPWDKLGLTEDQWLEKRRIGLTSYDIELENKVDTTTSWKHSLKDDAGSDIKHISENGELFSSLFLPGSCQYRSSQKAKGSVMVGLAGGSVIWCTASSISKRQFNVIPIITVLVPDMIWSFIDYKYKKAQERKALYK